MGFALRLQRFELIAFCGVILIGAAVLFVGAFSIEDLVPSSECVLWDGVEPVPAGCPEALAAYQSAAGPFFVFVAPVTLLPWAAAVVLGVPIVGRELERGTARLAWSLTASRARWFVLRTIPIVAVLAIVAFIAGVAVDRFFGVLPSSDVDPAKSFDSFGLRGVLIAARAALVFAIAVLAGALIGRVLPALIVAAALGSIAIVGVVYAHESILDGEATWLEGDYAAGDYYVDQGFRLADGTIVGSGYCDSDPGVCYDDEGNPRLAPMRLAVPGEQYRVAETREAIGLAGATAVTLLAAALVVRRRRPE